MNRRSIGFLSLALASACIAGTAVGQNAVPDLKGRWFVAAEAIVAGENPHVPGQSGITYSRIEGSETDGGIIIEEQRDRRFVGRVVTPNRTEQIIGVIAPDLENGVMVDEDGYYDFEIHDADTLEVCYIHILPKSRLAACNAFKRVVE